MRPIIIKVYIWLNPCSEQLWAKIDKILKLNYFQGELSYQDQLFSLNYEGEYFPYSELCDLALENLNSELNGKLDYIDLEEWTLTRTEIKSGVLSTRSASLDNAVKVHEFYRE